MASENLTDYEEIEVGDEVEILASEDMYSEGETGKVESIVRYTGTQFDRVAIYVVLDGADEPTEIPAMDLSVI